MFPLFRHALSTLCEWGWWRSSGGLVMVNGGNTSWCATAFVSFKDWIKTSQSLIVVQTSETHAAYWMAVSVVACSCWKFDFIIVSIVKVSGNAVCICMFCEGWIINAFITWTSQLLSIVHALFSWSCMSDEVSWHTGGHNHPALRLCAHLLHSSDIFVLTWSCDKSINALVL